MSDRCYTCQKPFDAQANGFRVRLHARGTSARGLACSRDVNQAFCSAACIRVALVEIAEQIASWDKVPS